MIDARLLTYRRGGIARYVAALLRWLPRVAPELRISPIVNRSTPELSSTARVFTPPHHRLERTSLGIELSVRRPSLVHSPDFIVPRVIGAKRVATVHDLNFMSHPQHLTRESFRYYGHLTSSLNRTDHIIAVSRYTADQLQERLFIDGRRITVIPNGVEIESMAATDSGTLENLIDAFGQPVGAKFSENRPIILMVGTIEPRKRHELMLDAVRLMRNHLTTPDALLVIAGQRGWNCDQIVNRIQDASNQGEAIWLENVGDDDLADLYRAATIVSIASLDEGFGLPLLEGMAAGVPVVAAKRGALPEVAGDAAILVEEGDPNAWASILGTLFEDVERRKGMKKLGLERAKQFSWETTARMTADLYREVLDS
ncbi:MAG: glycosyltransferase family 1 protein [Nitrolancea sp.]